MDFLLGKSVAAKGSDASLIADRNSKKSIVVAIFSSSSLPQTANMTSSQQKYDRYKLLSNLLSGTSYTEIVAVTNACGCGTFLVQQVMSPG